MIAKKIMTVAVGYASAQGKRPDNQDFGGFYEGSALERAGHGMIAAVADGVGGAKGGREAAELAVRALLEGYYAMPETIGPELAMQRSLGPFNSWLYGQGRSAAMENAATTFTALALRGRRAHLAHVGDSRAWRFADGHLACLTRDHVRPEPDLDHVLIRAIGIEPELRLDQSVIELAEHDRLLLTSDGVHGTLSEKRIEGILGERASAESTADKLVETAIQSGSQDNSTALVIDIVALPPHDEEGIASALADLPFVDPPTVGASIDGFEISDILSEGRYTVLLRGRDGADGAEVVLKFPRKTVLSDRAMRLAFCREIMVGAHVTSPHVGTAYPTVRERQSALYGVQPFYAGETMAQRAKNGRVPLDEAIAQAIRLAKGIGALHRLEIVHRDIKPENVILTEDGGLKLVDLGVARLPRMEDFAADEIPGTPGFLAPEQYSGSPGSMATDQFAFGVLLYHYLTGEWPYGEIEPFQRPRFKPPLAPSRHRSDIPAWLDRIILTCLAVEESDRFEAIDEVVFELENGGSVERAAPQRFVPLLERDPVRVWQAVSALLAIALIAALALR